MKFVYGKKQKVDSIDLDQLFTELQAALQKHPLVPAPNIPDLVSEWINDILFVAGKITEEELQEAMQSFEKVETSGKETATEGEGEEDSDEDEEGDE